MIPAKRSVFIASAIAASAAITPLAALAAAIGYVPYSGGTYTQDFDTLAYTSGTSLNTNNPITVNSILYTLPNSTASATVSSYSFSDTSLGAGTNALSTPSGSDPGMDGWWGTGIVATGSNATIANKYGANGGGQTTGGQVNYGGLSSSNRSLGLISTSTSGATSIGLALENTSASTTYTSFTLSLLGELWRQQTTAKFLHFGYLITPTNVSSDTSGGGALPTSGTTGDTNLDVSFATGTSTGNTDNTAPVSTENLSDTISGINWAPNTTLWLTYQTWAGTGASAAGSSQGLSIDNVNFSASAAVPEPASIALLAITSIGLLSRRRRQA